MLTDRRRSLEASRLPEPRPAIRAGALEHYRERRTVHASENTAQSFERVRAGMHRLVEARLGEWLAPRVEAARALAADVGDSVDAASRLALRGGKRLRAALAGAAYVASGGDRLEDVVMAGVALELLQTYLLIHDDWMDGDETRRGGPSVHAWLASRFGDGGAAAAVLAGDHACALAQEALLEVPLPAERLADAARELARAQQDVVLGQLLDVRAAARTRAQVETMHALKTSSYTVRAPLVIGAALAGASAGTRAALERFARPLGVAFQLRDDLLGVFGDPARTGKPAGVDVRRGKMTGLAAELLADEEGAALFARASRAGATEGDVAAAVRRMTAGGARTRVEARVAELAREARAALEETPLAPDGKTLLAGAIAALCEREL